MGDDRPTRLALDRRDRTQEALRLLGQILDGRDPVEAKATLRADLTISELCDLYLAQPLITTNRGTAKKAGRVSARSLTGPSSGLMCRFMLLLSISSVDSASDLREGKEPLSPLRGEKPHSVRRIVGQQTARHGKAEKCAQYRDAAGSDAIPTRYDRTSPRLGLDVRLRLPGRDILRLEADGENPTAITALCF